MLSILFTYKKKTMMKTKLLSIIIASFINAFVLAELSSAMENSSMYIYGTITTMDDTKYTGQIRWGKEEAFWFDFFNGVKSENKYLEHLSTAELDELKSAHTSTADSWGIWDSFRSRSWSISSSWSNDFSHSFVCQFGDIKSLEPARGDRVKVTLRNGDRLIIEDGSNDIGATISVSDTELGVLKIDWDDIDNIVFDQAPDGMSSAFGKPLYGRVSTTSEDYIGYVQWDHEERLGDDELNGELAGGSDLDIPFANIRSISKTTRGSQVTMASGRSIELMGTNDVDDDNRGIIVNIPGTGRVDIEWEDFERVDFDTELIGTSSYTEYDTWKLFGSVQTTSGESIEGEIVFDLDEAYNLEILDGEKANIDYSIPFRHISSIEPKSEEKCLVILNNGKEHILEASVDVTRDNDGILIKQIGKHDYTYLSWNKVERINFNRS